MKKVAILGERKAGLVEVPDPRPKENWAVVKIHAVPMCAEYKGFITGSRNEYLGHEAAERLCVDAARRKGKVAYVAREQRLNIRRQASPASNSGSTKHSSGH